MKTLIYESKKAAEVFIANSFIRRFLGYMFRKTPHHQAILITPCNSIHTFFMRFPIDVLFVDEKMTVIKKLEALEPGKVVMPQKKARMVVEAYSGAFKNIAEGKRIEISD